PNVEKLLADQQAMAAAMGTVTATSKQIANDIGGQAMRNLENDYVSKLSDEEKARFKAQSAQDKAWELKTQRGSDFNAAEDQMKSWGIGSANGRALEAVTALLVGGMSGQGGGQLAANALAPYAAQLIGSKFDTDHGSDPNVAAQALSHALLGAVLAELNGGSTGGGALSAAGGELAAGFLKNAFPNADRETISALSQAVGALAAGMAGGSLSSAALGAGIAKNSVENNRLLTATELVRIKELSDGGGLREAELTAAACALVKCSSGFAEGSAERAHWAAIEALGGTPEAQEDREWMKAQVQHSYLYTAGNGMAAEDQLFGYDATDHFFDWNSRNQIGTRTLGGLQALGGGLQAAGGLLLIPTCETVIGCIASGYLTVSGYDNAVAGSRTVVYGTSTNTWGGQIFQAAGLSPEAAELLYAMTQLGAVSRASTMKPGVFSASSTAPDPQLSYTQAPFTTRGLDVTADIMKTPEAQALVNEYMKSGATPALAKEYAQLGLASGNSLPKVINVGSGFELIKLVPKNAHSTAGSDAISAYSPFFVTREEYVKISRMTSVEAAKYLGLPAEQGIRGAHL
ncbi:VENN motif pre-toxin domain-containing protein, partial [Stenotrophomonas sp. P5_B8]